MPFKTEFQKAYFFTKIFGLKIYRRNAKVVWKTMCKKNEKKLLLHNEKLHVMQKHVYTFLVYCLSVCVETS